MVKNSQVRKAYSSKRRAKGLALLEILIAIGILGLIAAGVASLASRTFEEQNANAINSALTDMSLSIQKAYKRQSEYGATTGNNVADLVTANVIASGVAINPVTNDEYEFFPAKRTTGSPDNAFVFGIGELSPSLCTTLVTGGILQDAAYVEVTASATAIAAKVFSSATSFAAGTPNGIVKSSAGIAADINDPLTASDVCGNASNKIIVGYY